MWMTSRVSEIIFTMTFHFIFYPPRKIIAQLTSRMTMNLISGPSYNTIYKIYKNSIMSDPLYNIMYKHSIIIISKSPRITSTFVFLYMVKRNFHSHKTMTICISCFSIIVHSILFTFLLWVWDLLFLWFCKFIVRF